MPSHLLRLRTPPMLTARIVAAAQALLSSLDEGARAKLQTGSTTRNRKPGGPTFRKESSSARGFGWAI